MKVAWQKLLLGPAIRLKCVHKIDMTLFYCSVFHIYFMGLGVTPYMRWISLVLAGWPSISGI
jgi:hypothetical protein